MSDLFMLVFLPKQIENWRRGTSFECWRDVSSLAMVVRGESSSLAFIFLSNLSSPHSPNLVFSEISCSRGHPPRLVGETSSHQTCNPGQGSSDLEGSDGRHVCSWPFGAWHIIVDFLAVCSYKKILCSSCSWVFCEDISIHDVWHPMEG